MNLKLIAAIVLLVLVVAGLWLSYQAGQNQNELQCQATLGDLSAQSAKQKRISDEASRNEEFNRITQAQNEAARVQDIHKRHEAVKRSQPPITPVAGVCACRLSDDRIGLLREATDNPAIPEARNPAFAPDTKDQAL